MTTLRSFVACALVYLIALTYWVGQVKESAGELAFSSDRAYLDATVGTMLATKGAGSVSGVPATRDALWRVLIAMGRGPTGDAVKAACVIGALFGLLQVFLVVYGAKSLSKSQWFSLFAGALAVMSPSLALDAMSGSSVVVAACLVLLAFVLYAQAFAAKGRLLPLLSAVCIGLASGIRIELAMVWLLLWLHAGLLELGTKSRRKGPLYVLVQGLNGLLVIGLCIAPLVYWNYVSVGVPWPPSMGAPMTVDMAGGSRSLLSVAGQYLVLAVGALPQSFARFAGTPFLGGPGFKLLVLAGVAFLLRDLYRGGEMRVHSVFVIAMLIPVLHAAVSPFLGWGGADVVFRAVTPLWVLVAAHGLWEALGSFERWLEARGVAWPRQKLHIALTAIFGAIFLLNGMVENRHAKQSYMRDLNAECSNRAVLREVMAARRVRPERVVTDRPGWVAHTLGGLPIDLTGEATPDMLVCMDNAGRIDPRRVHLLLKHLAPQVLLLGGREFADLRDILPCGEPLRGSRPSGPYACELRWSEGF
jgi:hypothetical protein